MTTDLCAQARDLLPAYSIGATTDDETRFVESQMAHCPDLAHELRDYHMLSEGLMRNVPQLAPPPRLFENLMAAAAASAGSTNQQPSSVGRSPADAQQIAPLFPSKRKTDEKPRLTLRAMLAYGFVAALALALFGSNLYWLTQYNQLQDDRKELYDRYVWLEDELRAQNISFDTMRAPDTHWARMALPSVDTETLPQPDDPYAWIIWSASSESGVLMAQNFPRVEANKVYQLWGHSGDSDVSLATFRTDDYGEALVQVNVSTWGFERFWITAEPGSGSAAPSGDPVVRVRLD
jgi:hypothetical protein